MTDQSAAPEDKEGRGICEGEATASSQTTADWISVDAVKAGCSHVILMTLHNSDGGQEEHQYPIKLALFSSRGPNSNRAKKQAKFRVEEQSAQFASDSDSQQLYREVKFSTI